MEDNIEKKENNNSQPEKDMNFIEHAGTIQTGCVVGDHEYDIMDLVPDNQLTTVFLKCKYCGYQDVRSDSLNINSIINPEKGVDNKNMTPIEREAMLSPADLARLNAFRNDRLAEKQFDSFWDKIKHNS